MTARREFPTRVRVAALKRATDARGIIRCEECHGEAKGAEVDHKNPDGLTGEPTLENAMVLCRACHLEKTRGDVKAIAQAKRREARDLGAVRPKQTIKSAPMPKSSKRDRHPVPLPPRMGGIRFVGGA